MKSKAFPFEKRQLFILLKFFFIIFAYHILKDLKDSLVVTSSDAGAAVIPFIKIWVMLPASLAASFLITFLFRKYKKEKTLYFVVSALLFWYLVFAFFVYPAADSLRLDSLGDWLQPRMPEGMRGFVEMIRHWPKTCFYLSAELWSVLVLTVLFWGFVNDSTSIEEAKSFYPLCVLAGNCAGILSGQLSCYLSRIFSGLVSWEAALQLMISIVAGCGIAIMILSRVLQRDGIARAIDGPPAEVEEEKKSFLLSLRSVLQSKKLLSIAVLVIGFGMTNNLIEVVWKQKIKAVYPAPQEYNAYMNQITTIIGALSLLVALSARTLFARFSFKTLALLTPITLFLTSTVFFISQSLSEEVIGGVSRYFGTAPLYLVLSLGSLHYILALAAKYSLFDTCKEIGFLSIEKEKRIQSKAIVDTIGSRVGKSGASLFYQVLLVLFAAGTEISGIIGIMAVLMIGISAIAANHLGDCIAEKTPEPAELRTAAL